MRKCLGCGCEVSEGEKFCPECGARIPEGESNHEVQECTGIISEAHAEEMEIFYDGARVKSTGCVKLKTGHNRFSVKIIGEGIRMDTVCFFMKDAEVHVVSQEWCKDGICLTLELFREKEGEYKYAVFYTTVGTKWTPVYTVSVEEDNEVTVSLNACVEHRGNEIPTLTRTAVCMRNIVHLPSIKEVFSQDETSAEYYGNPTENREWYELSGICRPEAGKPVSYVVYCEKAEAEFFYEIYTKKEEGAYLTAVIQNPTAWFPAECEADVYFCGKFVGNTKITPKGNESLSLSLGVDNRIQVRYEEKEVEKFYDTVKNAQTVICDCRAEIENHTGHVVNFRLYDPLQEMSGSDAEIEMLDVSAGIIRPGEGMLAWDFRLDPEEKKELKLRFSVTCPQE